MIHVWTGKLRLKGPVVRGLVQPLGPEVKARVTHLTGGALGSDELTLEVCREHDAFGQPRWTRVGFDTVTPESLCLALALERTAWVRMVNATREERDDAAVTIADRERGRKDDGPSKAAQEYTAAKDGLRSIGVDVDSLIRD